MDTYQIMLIYSHEYIDYANCVTMMTIITFSDNTCWHTYVPMYLYDVRQTGIICTMLLKSCVLSYYALRHYTHCILSK